MNYLQALYAMLFLSITLTINTFAAGKLTVFVSILPHQYFVQRIGEEYVDVHVMVGPGQNPETYEPTPKQMTMLADADIYFTIGIPLESVWLDKVKRNNKNLLIIECCNFIPDLINQDSSHDHKTHAGEHNTDFDPHVWTSPNKVKQISRLIEKSLIEIDQINSVTYRNSTTKFIGELDELNAYVRTKIECLKRRIIIVSHPAWSYFADQYGFTQIPIEQEGKEIQAYSMVKLIERAQAENVKAIFVQPQFSIRGAEVIANEIGAKIIELDPLAFDYIHNMRIVTDRIVEGLRH